MEIKENNVALMIKQFHHNGNIHYTINWKNQGIAHADILWMMKTWTEKLESILSNQVKDNLDFSDFN